MLLCEPNNALEYRDDPTADLVGGVVLPQAQVDPRQEVLFYRWHNLPSQVRQDADFKTLCRFPLFICCIENINII